MEDKLLHRGEKSQVWPLWKVTRKRLALLDMRNMVGWGNLV